ncbi:MAG: LLM class flavin-dependent oxidoreductase [Actinomycetota bacterium]
MTIRIAVSAGPGGDALMFVQEAERLGVHSVWTAEAWGTDALTPLAFFAAKTSSIKLGSGIVQVGARTPAMTAMSAMSMEYLSGGRFLLGLGTSGPQVMEGWHGVPFRSPIQRTRETIEIVRMVSSGEKLAYAGKIYTLPLPDGPGRSIRSAAPPVHIPIYIAALGPANLRLTGELADGWVGTSFMPESAGVFLDELRAGAESAGRSLHDLDLQVPASVEFTDDVDEAAKRHARGYGFTFGAMGSREQNFYLNAFARQGYQEVAREVQRLWRDGEREQARDLVPTEIGMKTNLLGTDETIAERLRAYRDAGITTIRAGIPGETLDQRLATLGRLMDVVNEVNAAKI